jgi:glyoxylase-like metal-dependent hydrolase (beta-lactamase superfamily II)
MAGYLAGLRRLRDLPLAVLCPGHGPPVEDPAAKLDEYLAHRLDRERRLLAALAAGRRGVEELLDQAWDDVPPELRPAAAVTLRAHLDKLADEGRLPAGVELPDVPAELRA